MATIEKLKEDLRYAREGLAQMQEPDAGYFEDINNKQPHEFTKFSRDMRQQGRAIARLERQIAQKESER